MNYEEFYDGSNEDVENIRDYGIGILDVDLQKWSKDFDSYILENNVFTVVLDKMRKAHIYSVESFLTLYKMEVVRVINNLKYYYSGEKKDYAVEHIPMKSRSELHKSKWDNLYTNRSEVHKKILKKGAHQCPSCKSWYTEYNEAQRASADESMTVFISCICGNHWKY